MATVKYQLQSKGKNAQIYVRLSNGRGANSLPIAFKKRTGLTINYSDWSTTTSMPKQNIAENKSLFNQLKSLESFIYAQLNEDTATGVIINSKWLEMQIDKHFGRSKDSNSTLLVDQIQFFIDNANIRDANNGKIGLNKLTIANYCSFKKIIVEFQKSIKKEIHFVDIQTELLNKFKVWLINTKQFSVNYAGKNIRMLKTVLNDAVDYGKTIPNDINRIKTIKEQDNDRYIHTLSPEELDKIFNTEMPSTKLEDAKKWLIIGCYVGQRKSDLLRITPENIRQTAKGIYIDIVQKKTTKHVTVAVAEPYVIDILLNNFPNPVSDHELGKYFRKVCEIAKIDQPVKGYKILVDEKTKIRRKEFAVYPKYEVITSHCCRRSFATNFYKKMPTSILIGITGHSTETMFLNYINKKTDKDDNADLFMQYYEQMTKNLKPQMTVIKKAN